MTQSLKPYIYGTVAHTDKGFALQIHLHPYKSESENRFPIETVGLSIPPDASQ